MINVDRNAMLRMLNMYGGNGILVNAIQSFYAESEVCKSVEKRVNGLEWKSVCVKVVLCLHGCSVCL